MASFIFSTDIGFRRFTRKIPFKSRTSCLRGRMTTRLRTNLKFEALTGSEFQILADLPRNRDLSVGGKGSADFFTYHRHP